MRVSEIRVKRIRVNQGLGVYICSAAFIHPNPKLLGLDRQFGQINLGALGVFLANLSAPILVL